MKPSLFEKDFSSISDRFPKLKVFWLTDRKCWILKGSLDICDVDGQYWDTFDIGVVFPPAYPYGIPIVFEMSNIIPREDDWHISKDGACCLDEEHVFLAWSKTGINVSRFLTEKVYPYFANQLYKLRTGNYAGAEYAHFTAGIIQYYCEELKLVDHNQILLMIDAILEERVARNRPCPCGSGKKLKRCHLNVIDTMIDFGKEKISKDKLSILKYISTDV